MKALFPGLGRINPKDVTRMMRQMGIKAQEMQAKRVIFELEDKKLVVENPQVTAMEVSGQKTYTVIGQAKEEANEIPLQDIQMVAAQAGVSEQKAKKALEKVGGDLAQAITELKNEKEEF